MAKIVVLDGGVFDPGDMNWKALEAVGELTKYETTSPDQIVERARGATHILTNKVYFDADMLSQLSGVRFIGLLATGYNNIDTVAARKYNIDVCNAEGYSTPAVAQHTFSLLQHLTNHVALHNQSVQSGEWSTRDIWCYWKAPLVELSGKTMGLLGFGDIAKAVARIALAYDMRVIAHRHSDRPSEIPGVEIVDWDTVVNTADVLSLHAPLTDETQHIINADVLSRMKKSAFLINTARGGLVEEEALREALMTGQIAGAGLDVLGQEPPNHDHPLIGLPNCVITPHIAWVTQEARSRLMDIVVENIKMHIAGTPINVVN